jgi:hypothetical protein
MLQQQQRFRLSDCKAPVRELDLSTALLLYTEVEYALYNAGTRS